LGGIAHRRVGDFPAPRSERPSSFATGRRLQETTQAAKWRYSGIHFPSDTSAAPVPAELRPPQGNKANPWELSSMRAFKLGFIAMVLAIVALTTSAGGVTRPGAQSLRWDFIDVNLTAKQITPGGADTSKDDATGD